MRKNIEILKPPSRLQRLLYFSWSLFALGGAPPLSAERDSNTLLKTAAGSVPYSLTVQMDWPKQTLYIDLAIPISGPLLETRYTVNNIIEQNLSSWLYQSIKEIQINSSNTLEDLWETGQLPSLSFFQQLLQKDRAVFHSDFKTFQNRYSLPLLPKFINLFGSRVQRPIPPNLLGQSNEAAYTGLIIYARDPMPLHGEQGISKHIVPALFPKIYDADMRLIFDEKNPEEPFLRKWGAVLYQKEFDEEKVRSRIGPTPLRIKAVGLFGSVPTDLLITSKDADKILSNETARKALRECRIVFIY